jgi:protein subunit release factor A
MAKGERVLSVTLKDCRVDTFRCSGHGGQNVNKRDTGVRIVHEPSGAVGESREERSQLQNKRTAFKRMAAHPRFKV